MASSRKRSTSSRAIEADDRRVGDAHEVVAAAPRVDVDDLHAAAAEHEATGAPAPGSRSPRPSRGRRRRRSRCRCAGRREARVVEQPARKRSRSSARSIAAGLVPRIVYPASSIPLREAERRLAAELARSRRGSRRTRASACSTSSTSSSVERLEVQAVGGVVVGRHRLGVAVDHDRLVARRRAARTTACTHE